MARPDINRFGEMEVFVRAVDLGGFSAAARALRMTPSAVSKLVARLEKRLGARLVNRSTRALQLTPEGCTFYERSVRLLAQLEEAERGVSTSDEPVGRLRVNTSSAFGRCFLIPHLPAFIARYPAMSVDVILTDQIIDLIDDRTDVAIRAGPMKSSQLVTRKLFETRMVIVGAPAYLERHGMPRAPSELLTHQRLGFSYTRAVEGWPLTENGATLMVPPSGGLQASEGEALRLVALAGGGLARLAHFQVAEDLAAGTLLPVLEAFNPGDTESFHAVFVGQGGQLPARVRVFLDHLTATVRWR
ncbi:LysR family transcriptional regulator [Myxococcus sp. K15C18031901]|uniref:LysR family transcriptional regulator n=1 Tax=Myxococcus dinghuensis TaxID=2906761 RepID=UPI0020A7A0C8|nr:LysR family transcriptional regulator [Myxococcus dinghuensis]MCP3097491.1 LysR family transcriptional regulator [Myxococcus dinghuensis]